MKAIADTGAFSSAMSQKHFDKIYNHLTQKPIKKAPPLRKLIAGGFVALLVNCGILP